MRMNDMRNQRGNAYPCHRRTNDTSYKSCRFAPQTQERRQENTACECKRTPSPCTKSNPQEGERLLALIRRLDFALVETNLYLDTHPYSCTALKYFERLLNERNQAVARYEADFGPLTAMGNGARDEWLWSTGAWPWQINKENGR